MRWVATGSACFSPLAIKQSQVRHNRPIYVFSVKPSLPWSFEEPLTLLCTINIISSETTQPHTYKAFLRLPRKTSIFRQGFKRCGVAKTGIWKHHLYFLKQESMNLALFFGPRTQCFRKLLKVYQCTLGQLSLAIICLKWPRPVFHNFIQAEALLVGGDFSPFPQLPDLS